MLCLQNSNELSMSIQIVILERLNTPFFFALLILFMRTFCVLSIGFENDICFLISCYSINPLGLVWKQGKANPGRKNLSCIIKYLKASLGTLFF